MAAEVIAIADDDDDEISIISSTPVAFKSKSGATKSDAIPVEGYRRSCKRTIVDDDVVEISPSLFASNHRNKRLCKGESSNSKTEIRRSLFTCEICTDEKPMSESFNISGCNHFYCTQCISNYVAAQLQNSIININCPVPGCRGFLEAQHCREILPKEVFDRWGDALCEALILGRERYYCPYKNCSALLIDDGGEKLTQTECPECRRMFCVACKAAWHSGMSCEGFKRMGKDEMSKDDEKLINLAKKKKWVRCPRCRIFVSKHYGCQSMSCRCGCYFCYKCGAERCKCYRWKREAMMRAANAIFGQYPLMRG